MRRTLSIILFVLMRYPILGQSPTVPSVIQFADMELRLNERTREEIQLDVDALTRSQKYFNIKLDRVIQYFPIIERVLREENVPDDFKYLVIQESALIPDAISSANAVGFWQFKESSGQEVGLRIDRNIDERMNVVSATRGACRYLKTNNFYYDNWLYALLAYNTGRGGAETHIDSRHFGDKKMEINKHTHWYVKKYLAHKIAFQDALAKDKILSRYLYEYTDGGGSSLSEIAAELNVDPDELINYNKWVRRGRIPTDKVYTVIVPTTERPQEMIAMTQTNLRGNGAHIPTPERGKYPLIKHIDSSDSRLYSINGIPGTLAKNGDDIEKLADLGGIPMKDFLKYNDIDIAHQVIPGQVYYFKKKRNKAREHYHTAYPGENSWTIAQKYGIKEKRLLRKNRIRINHSDFKNGRIVWLRFIRPEDQPIEYAEITSLPPGQNQEEVSRSTEAQTFNNPVTETISSQKGPDTEPDNYIDTHFEQPKENSIEQNGVESIALAGYVEDHDQSQTDGALSTSPLFHIVEAGETLYGISRKYGVSVEDLRLINDISMGEELPIGRKIYLKNPFPDEPSIDLSRNNESNELNSYIIYHVKKGETLYAISKRFNVTVAEIMNWNQKNDYSIKEGDMLRIKRD